MSVPAESSHPGEEGRASPHVRYTKQSVTAIDRLADDLLVEILSRVPAKSLLRFRCVSSHWLALIDHPDHRKRLPQTPVGFFYGSNFEWFLEPPFHFTSFPGRRWPPIDASCSFLPNHRRVHLLDCCNGLFLCRWCDASAQGDEFRYVVCNPATEKWLVLPSSGKASSEVATARLGFDPALSSHFHVFELVEEQESIFPWDPDIAGVTVYSSETGGWVYKEERWNEQIRPIDHCSAFVFLDGYLHFQANARWLSRHLAVVDTEGERWMSFSVPGGLVDGFIQRSQGRLHYANFQRDGDGVIRLVVYVLDNYQSREWIVKHSVGASYIFGGIDAYLEGGFGWIAMDFDWIAIHPECNTIFFTAGWGTTFMCYNMDLQQVKVISNLEDGKPAYLPYVPLYAELQSLHAL